MIGLEEVLHHVDQPKQIVDAAADRIPLCLSSVVATVVCRKRRLCIITAL